MAHLSGDPALGEAFREEQDIHARTAAEVFGVPPEEVTAEQRRSAKTINFGLIYGMSDFGLARELGIDRAEAAQPSSSATSQRYPGRASATWTRRASRRAEQGYVRPLFGRRRSCPEITHASGRAAPGRASARRSTRRSRARRPTSSSSR